MVGELIEKTQSEQKAFIEVYKQDLVERAEVAKKLREEKTLEASGTQKESPNKEGRDGGIEVDSSMYPIITY